MATVPLVCFHLIEKHTPDRVVRQFGMIQEIPHDVDTDAVLHKIDLRGKVGVDWVRKHAQWLLDWGNRLERHFEVVLGNMPPQHEYFGWFNRVTQRFIDRRGAKLTMLVSSPCLLYLTVLLSIKPLFTEHDICYYIFYLALAVPIICNYY